ncbi:D-amino acid dehydrogenase [Roseibium algae]|uniref:D-amino acid dehydrogenase n=1 Tax=Roseibium algae TaxID=3123038 RepID=A0ABU8THZ8_9HYPH
MHILVIGAGVIGLTSAWYLSRDGHQVTLLDRNDGPGLGTSFGNAGGVCPGFAGPWAAPGMPFKALRWMFQSQAPLKVRPRMDLAQWAWLAQFVLNCSSARFGQNKTRMQKVAHFSKACLQELRGETGIEYDQRTEGVLQVFSTDEEAEGGARSAAVLEQLGIPHQLLSSGDLTRVEPALAASGQTFSGGLHLTTDEIGDCHKFCQELARLISAQGACRIQYGTTVQKLLTESGKIIGVQSDKGDFQADAVVIAAGPWARALLDPLGVKVPLYPVKGYSITAEITDLEYAPRSSVMDEHSKVMVTRLGNRIRAAGIAELAGFDASLPTATIDALRHRVAELFPGAADYGSSKIWCGFRPMTPDGPSITEARGFSNLWLNVGHGSNGWTQACGTGQLLANRVAGRPTPEIEC